MARIRARLPRVFRVRALRLRVLTAVAVIVAAFTAILVDQMDGALRAAFLQSGQEQARALSRSFQLAERGIERADLGQRLEALRQQTPGVARVDLFVERSGQSLKIASTDPSTLADAGVRADTAPLHDGQVRFREVRQHDRHLLQTVFPLRDGGRAFASAALYFDLSRLDAAAARSRRNIAVTGLLAGALMAAALMLVLRLGLFRPLDRMRLVTRRLATGDLEARLRWSRVDELGALSADFDAMATALQSSHERLEGLALTDPLTGLANHRAFHEALDAELQRARREVYDVAVVALDIDCFKTINDSWGHSVGDEALRLVAQSLRVHTRPGDIIGRVGGDEFALALVRADGDMGQEVVDRIRAAVRRLGVGPHRASVTLSAGVTEFPARADTQEQLLERADAALYESKRTGRDRTSQWRDEVTAALHDGPTDAPGAGEQQMLDTVHGLARAVDAKDAYTHRHSHRVATYAVSLARALGIEGEPLRRLHTAGVLHDVGKIGVPDAVLLKSGGLTAGEMTRMRRHSELGADIIAGAGLPEIARWVRHLHERFDGGGYPDALGGTEIPLESRLLAVADAFEAMISSRVYRPALTVELALEELERCAGTHFDPALALRFVALVRSGGVRLEPIAA
jgi:diguanylate cyclase (GGDEF)-like protein